MTVSPPVVWSKIGSKCPRFPEGTSLVLVTKVDNATSKRNGIIHYHCSHVIRDITIKIDVSYEPRAITERSDNFSSQEERWLLRRRGGSQGGEVAQW